MMGTGLGMLRLGRIPDSGPYSREALGHLFSLSILTFPIKQGIEPDDFSVLL